MIRARRDERGVGMIEFALVVPVLVYLLLGVVDYGRFLYYDQTILSAARDGAEMAINHCPSHTSCGLTDTPVTDDIVVQATACDASPDVTLQPQPSTCNSCLTASCSSICTTTCLAEICQQDICVSPLASGRTNGTDVTVSVGYNFTPFTPFIDQFFPVRSCWSGDSTANHHTLCASATGSVY